MIQEEKIQETEKVVPILGEIFRGRQTGALRLDSESGTRVFYFKDGELISIGTTIEKEKIDEILLRDGKITREHIKEALERSNSFAQIGKQLISFGFLKSQELEDALKKQANIVLYNILKEGSAKISFIEGHEPTRTDVFYYPTHLWLLDFLMGIEEREIVFKLLPPLNNYVGRQPEVEEFLEILPWDEEDKELVRKLNGTFTLAEATSYSRKKEMEIYKKLAFLNSFGVLSVLKESQKKPEQAALFTPLEVQSEVAPPVQVNVELPLKKKNLDRRRKIFFVYPLVGSVFVIVFLSAIFIYYSLKSRQTPSQISKPPQEIKKEVKQEEKPEEEVMVLTPQKVEKKEEKIEKEVPLPEVKETPPVETIKEEKKKEETVVKPAEEKPSINKPPGEKVSKSSLYMEAENFLREARTLPQNYFTIQILIACQEETILKLKKEYPDFNFWYIPINFKGRSCYKLFYEKLESKEEAERVKEGLPSKLKEGKPQVVSFTKALQDAP